MPKESNTKSSRYTVPAVEQAARLLFCLAEADTTHMSLTRICAEVGLHESRAFSILETLQQYGLAQRNVGGKGYSLGPGLITLSRKVIDNFNAPRLAEPFLKELAVKSGSTAILGLIVDEDETLVAAKYEGGSDVGLTVNVGRRHHITHGAVGKAIAAFLPKDKLARLLRRKNIYYHGEPERFDKKRFEKELVECRRLGYALDLEEIRKGFNAVTAPVLGANNYPIGHITVIGLLSADAARQLGPLVAEAGRNLSRLLGADIT